MDADPNAPLDVVNINGQDIPVSEAQELIETGRKTREYETKYNTKLDSVWPEYTKLSQERSSWNQKEQEYQRQINEFKSKQERGVETPADVQEARNAAKKLGIVLDEDIKDKFVSKDDLEKWYTGRREQERTEEAQVKAVYAEADRVADELKKINSPVPFNKKAVIAYAGAYGFTDLRAAYEDMFAEQLAPWKEAQLAAKKSPSLKTLQPGQKKAPEAPRVTSDNFKDMVREVAGKE